MRALLATLDHLPTRPQNTQRVFHGRGGLHPGCEHLALDWFGPAWLLTAFEPLSDGDLAVFQASLESTWQRLAPGEPLTWVYQGRRIDESGQQSETRLMAGALPEPHVVTEAGARYEVHLLRGQNHGLFLDMAEGRRWVRAHAEATPGLKVLNLFAYSCAFSVAALMGGAAEVINVDMAAGPLQLGRRNHVLNGVQGRAQFLAHDVFTSWGKIKRLGPYGLVILDPPSFQKGSFVATKDYARLLRKLPDLVAPGGHALLCLNTPKLGSTFLTELLAAEAPDFEVVQRLPNPAAFADADVERALKVMAVRATGEPTAATHGGP
ncbi:class I SAM-dependent methyltransferase [Inhella gelatinilytica]|uniref:Class I SAM-dependent methyltransferase n=1 Tax=Inhella gelatinilytica TaxID=2795030 RepID=A0A931IYG6_9BURK|nr:class I SAM-dependent methyltransferase [Inhella gelatinilytica]MBH9552323.1 class I SAM-dependent methyltransferase [Inhella gelatinilytica]